jgi:hypothetical protein
VDDVGCRTRACKRQARVDAAWYQVTSRPLSIDCLTRYLDSLLSDAEPTLPTQICVTGDESHKGRFDTVHTKCLLTSQLVYMKRYSIFQNLATSRKTEVSINRKISCVPTQNITNVLNPPYVHPSTPPPPPDTHTHTHKHTCCY